MTWRQPTARFRNLCLQASICSQPCHQHAASEPLAALPASRHLSLLLLQTLSSNLNRAERENATVYLMRIPNAVDLPAIQPYVLVKSLPLPDLDGSTEGMFQQVIPDSRCVGWEGVSVCCWFDR